MAYTGQTITNPITHEEITFVRTTAETNGESLVFDCRVTPGGATLPVHKHDTQEERFEVIYGELGVRLGNRKQILRRGEKIILPAKIKHQWWVPGDQPVLFRVEVVPARNLEMVLEVISAMAHSGKMNSRSMPKNPFELANIGRLSENYLPFLPVWMQKIMLTMGSRTGALLGVDPQLARYQPTPLTSLETATESIA